MPKPGEHVTASSTPAHALGAHDVLRYWAVSPETGLSRADCAERLARHGPNRLTARRGKSPLMFFLSQCANPLVLILLAAALITVVMGDWVDASVIAGVVFINAVIGFVQEMNALKAIRALSHAVPFHAMVLRTVLVGLMLTVAAFSYFEWEIARGHSIETARTAALNMFALGEAFYLFNCRSLNGSVWSVSSAIRGFWGALRRCYWPRPVLSTCPR